MLPLCEDFSEEQTILERIRLGDESAFELLLDICMPMIRQETARFRPSAVDADDLLQEASLGLLSAAKAYRTDGGASFLTFARVCVRRRLLNALRSVPEVEIPHESPMELSNGETEEQVFSPDRFVLEKEEELALLSRLKGVLSELEYRVLILHMSSYSYGEIAQTLQVPAKSIDNAIQRIRRKLKSVLK